MYRSFSTADSDVICSWIRTRSEFDLVGSEGCPHLTKDVLQQWVSTASKAIVLVDPSDTPVAFCALSRAEHPSLDRQAIEICHFIVSPAARFGWTAMQMLDAAIATARGLGYERVIGRIVPTNRRMYVIGRFKAFVPEHGSASSIPGFLWLSRSTSEITRAAVA